jgi:hypothetical protein
VSVNYHLPWASKLLILYLLVVSAISLVKSAAVLRLLWSLPRGSRRVPRLCECGRPHHVGSKDTYDQRYLCRRCDSLIRTHDHLSLPLCVGITPTLNQDRTAIDHNGLTCTESFLHQKQEGLCNVMSFADAPHGQTLGRAFIELLPF